MQDKKIAEYKQMIADIPSLKLIDFDVQLQWVSDLILSATYNPIEISKISRKDKSFHEQMEWMRNILQQQDIKGTFFLSCGPRPVAKVELGDDYGWVEPLWEIYRDIQLVPLDQTYYLFVSWTENCIGDDCLVVKKARNPSK